MFRLYLLVSIVAGGLAFLGIDCFAPTWLAGLGAFCVAGILIMLCLVKYSVLYSDEGVDEPGKLDVASKVVEGRDGGSLSN
jgi:hypothetical protein